MFISGEFRQSEPVEPAVVMLREQGFSAEEIEIYSDKPVELSAGVLDRPSRMSLGAVIGAALGGSLATAFMYYTQLDYPLVTGGMPLTSRWATGVITYEFTMAGAMLATVVLFLRESGLLRNLRRRPAARFKEGVITLRVRCSETTAQRAADTLRQAGATQVATAGGEK